MSSALTQIQLPSVAKLNLFLHINGRRADGYHELQTCFQFIDFADDMTFTKLADGELEFHCSDASIAGDDNLVVKAVRLLEQASERRLSLRIDLQKRLPMGGGIGGGSSNAATTLMAVNALFALGFERAELLQMARKLGADVPIFIHGKACIADGIGELFSDFAPPESAYLLVHPNDHVSTGLLFSHPDLPRATPKFSMAQLREQPLFSSAEQGSIFHNDFEVLVKKLYPKVENTLSWLLEYAPSRMTGTGACCFAVFANTQQVESTLAHLPTAWNGYSCRGRNVSPTHQALADYGFSEYAS